MQRRGQITLFAIIGILLVLVVAIVSWLLSLAQEERINEQADEMIEEFVQTNALQHYVSSCLEKVTAEGVLLMGRQGGVIYERQGGLTPDEQTIGEDRESTFTPGKDYYPFSYRIIDTNGQLEQRHANISYGIKSTLYDSALAVACPSAIAPVPIDITDDTTGYYPVQQTFFSDYPIRYINYYFSSWPGCGLLSRRITWSGYLGLNNLPSLCAYDGPNAEANICNALYGYDTSYETTAMERQITSYVEHNLPRCVDFTLYEDMLGSNITIIDDPNISILFQRPRGLRVDAQYPFLVSVQGREPIHKQVDFTTTLPVNMHSFFNYVFNLVKNAVRDPYFSLHDDWNDFEQNSFYLPFYEVSLLNSRIDCDDTTSSYCQDKVLIITDTSSILLGKPLSFYFAIAQRKPVLDYLHDARQDTSITIDDETKPINFMFQTGDRAIIPISFADPDDDDVQVNITGWKETYDETFDKEACLAEGNCFSNLAKHMTEIELADNAVKWSDSFTSQTPSTRVTYDTTEDDAGYHEVTIVVEDEHLQKDFQIVRLIIFDLPKAVLRFINYFADINNTYASVEDPYTFDASGSRTSTISLANGEPTLNFTFFDRTEIENGFVAHPDKKLHLPEHDSTTIGNITQTWFTQTGQHNISLVVQQDGMLTSNEVKKTITVAECLPHGYEGYKTDDASFSKDDFTGEPFPYANNQDPYAAAHVCCQPETLISAEALVEDSTLLTMGTRASDEIICFAKDFMTTYPYQDYSLLATAWYDNTDKTSANLTRENYGNSFIADAYEGYSFDQTPTTLDFSSDLLNDVFSVSYEQYCSGYRGNICGGELSTTWEQTVCDDFDSNLPEQFARCQGPTLARFNYEQESLSCKNYDGENNFERELYFSFTDTLQDAFETYYTENYPAETRDLLLEGYCAPPQETNLANDGTLTVVNDDGAFTCTASCDDGTCAYAEPADCHCSQYGVCDELSAADFVIGGNVLSHRCVQTARGKVACLPNCKTAPSNSAPSCSCRGGVYIANQCCEPGNQDIFVEDASTGCFEGIPFTPTQQLSETRYGNTLFCQGTFLVCSTTTFDETSSHVQIIAPDSETEYCEHVCLPADNEWHAITS